MNEKTKLYYTFGNHMHWVDMEWLWGYHVLPGSVRDMLHFCRETGTKGNVNFDGVGYEKLAAENPEALFDLRAAVSAGQIEPVGCSYGQPYGLFHGGESNIRQRIYGARSVRRLLGVWPKTFWEEEFDFFPQLPQILKGCGFTGASLFFQWTWHTPEVPREDVPVIWWEGTDGSRLKTTTRNRLNLHQWPEDVDTMLADVAAHGVGERPLVQQWLELMPSPDWMCRSEVLLPKMKELLADERFDVSPVTLGEYLESSPDDVPVRRYQMDDVWHGLTLGRNGDYLRDRSAVVECMLLKAEAFASICSVLGRPYVQWDVYPIWELEEAWRHLLKAQHHDNDECEGLCGHVGYDHYDLAVRLAENVFTRAFEKLKAQKDQLPEICLDDSLPIFQYRDYELPQSNGVVESESDYASLQNAAIKFTFDRKKSTFTLQNIAQCDEDLNIRIGTVHFNGKQYLEKLNNSLNDGSIDTFFRVGFWSNLESRICVGDKDIYLRLARSIDEAFLDTLEPGIANALMIEFELPWDHTIIWTGTPYSVEQIILGSSGVRKYPAGDWMTSNQWFESIEGAFTGLNFIDIEHPDGSAGLHIAFSGTKQWIKKGNSIYCIIHTNDPWDGEDFKGKAPYFLSAFKLTPHGRKTAAWKYKLGQLHTGTLIPAGYFDVELSCNFANIKQENVLITALYRETEDFSGRHLDNYAGHVLAERIFGDVQPEQSRVYPFVMRLVEFDDITGEIELTICGEVSSVFKTNLLGQVETELRPEPIEDSPCKHPHTGKATKIRVPMRGKEIATLYFDIVEGRKQTRDLDAKREIWAQVHRIED